MRARLLKYWELVRTSFWFLPLLMILSSVVLAFSAVRLDETVTDKWLRDRSWAYNGGAEGASAVLGAIAGSMITIAGVVFSLTLVALSLASSQFGPRLLRTFMRDTTNQAVLGTFVSTFLYCLLVLRTIRRADELAFVPHLAVSLGVLFAFVSLCVLIYFIHHVSVSIQADEIIARVGEELLVGIDRLFPDQVGHCAGEKEVAGFPAAFERDACPVVSTGDGYLQIIDGAALLSLAKDRDVYVRIERRPGDFVVHGTPLATVWPGDAADDDFVDTLNMAFVLGSQRTPSQDIEFTIDQLVEIAARALSPGINDPFTAITCVDRLGSALSKLARRDMPSPYRYDSDDRLRIIAPRLTFEHIADQAFDPIRRHARSSAAVVSRLLQTIGVVAYATHREHDRAVLRRHALLIARSARHGVADAADRRSVQARYKATLAAIDEATDRSEAEALKAARLASEPPPRAEVIEPAEDSR